MSNQDRDRQKQRKKQWKSQRSSKNGFWDVTHYAIGDGWGATLRLCMILLMLGADLLLYWAAHHS